MSDPGELLVLLLLLSALVGEGWSWLRTAGIGVGKVVNDYRAVDAGEADAVRVLVSAMLSTGKSLSAYKPPNMNMNMICNFSFKGFCNLYNKGMGMIKMAKSVSTLKAATMVAPTATLMQ